MKYENRKENDNSLSFLGSEPKWWSKATHAGEEL